MDHAAVAGVVSACMAATALLLSACTMMPPENDRLRIARIENAVLPMAKAALEAGQWETARRLYTRLLEVDAGSAEARMGMGDTALARRASARAANWYLAAAAHAGDRETRHAALLAHGRAALAAGDLEAARASFDRLADPAEEASPADAAWGFNGVGIVSLLEGRPAEAVAAIEQAVLRLPDEERFQGNLARSLALAARASGAGGETPRASAAEASDRVEPPAQPRDREPPGTPVHVASVASPGSGTVEPAPAPVEEDGRRPEPAASVATTQAARVTHLTQRKDADNPQAVETAQPPEETAGKAAVEDVDWNADTPVETAQPPEQEAANADSALAANGNAVETAPPPEEGLRKKAAPGARLSFPGAFRVRLETGEFLQVGAFAREEYAQNTRSRLLEVVRLPVRIESAERAGRPIYRVRIGPVAPDMWSALARNLGVDGAARPRKNDPSPPTETTAAASVASQGQDPLPIRKTETPIHVVENGTGFLQVGAYANHAAALALAAELRGLTRHPVTLSELARESDPALYRVRIGPVDADARPALLRQIAAR